MAAVGRSLPGMARLFTNFVFQRQSKLLSRQYTVTGIPKADKALNVMTGGKIEGWLKAYENVVGLTQVREAQAKVIQAEVNFEEGQLVRRDHQHQLTLIQERLRALSAEIEKVHRGEEKYLALLTQEHDVIKDEQQKKEQIKLADADERAKFALLSSAVRESHEKERVRTERTKYWSIIGSVVGAIIGILGTSINNYLRMREIRGIVTDSAEGSVEMRELVHSLSDTMSGQHNQMQKFVVDLKGLLGGNSFTASTEGKLLPVKQAVSREAPSEQLESQTREILALVKNQDGTMQKEMSEIKQILGKESAMSTEGNVVYVGPEMEDMLGNTERNLEWRLKINALVTVTMIYGAFALTLPILYNIFRGAGG